MTLQKASTRQYKPLSINDSDDESRPLHQPSRFSFLRCKRRRAVCTLLIFLSCLVLSALLAMKAMFHTSFSNLLRTIFGRASTPSLMEAACLYIDSTSVDTTLRKISVDDLQYNKRATSTSKMFHGIVSNGFLWDEEDAITSKWRPQGVSTYHTATRYALISWYGRKDEGYANRGGRISFVDISKMDQCTENNHCSYPYVHILLVDENYCTLPNIHVGGIEQVNNTLYVADSRKGMQQILEFDLHDGIYEIASSNSLDGLFGYRYVLRQSSSFASPIKPSFLSFDVDNGKFVIGTYARCGPKVGVHLDSISCFTQSKNQLVWFGRPETELISINATSFDDFIGCWHYFSEMQGAASARVDSDTIVWISSSYGPMADSHLHVVNMTNFTGECPSKQSDDDLVDLDGVTIYNFPPGLEDLHIELFEENRFMWMTTEFGTRMVFASSLSNLLEEVG